MIEVEGNISEPVDLGQLVKEVEEEISVLIEEAGARIVCEKLPIVNGTKINLKRVLINIIENAIKFRKQDGRPCVNITSSKENKFWKIKITDNGIGFDEKYASDIFQMYRRLELNNAEGTGVGLAMCWQIIRSHGGEIWAESKIGQW